MSRERERESLELSHMYYVSFPGIDLCLLFPLDRRTMKRVLITQSGFVMVVLVAPADMAATIYTNKFDSWCPK